MKATSLATGDLPTRSSVGHDQAFVDELDKKMPGTGVFVENLANVQKARPTVEQYPAISEALGQAVVSVMLGNPNRPRRWTPRPRPPTPRSPRSRRWQRGLARSHTGRCGSAF